MYNFNTKFFFQEGRFFLEKLNFLVDREDR